MRLRPADFVCALLLLIAAAGSSARADDPLVTLTVGGQQRSYQLHIPASLPKDRPAALVIDLHGGGGSAESAAKQTGFAAEADRGGFVLATPNGSGRDRPLLSALGKPGLLTWNAGACCAYAQAQGIDDVGFMRALVADVGRRVPLDPKRIYATGLSNGGMMAYRLACEASDLFAAIGVVSGVVMVSPCKPRFPVAVLHIHSDADQNVPLAGGVGPKALNKQSYPPVMDSITFWAAHDDCGREPIVSTPAPGVTLKSYPMCAAGTAVDFYLIAGGGHSWPGGQRMLKRLDEPSQALKATPLIWQFFKAHPKP
jgi:polyhydroxybutyrate depolymerase